MEKDKKMWYNDINRYIIFSEVDMLLSDLLNKTEYFRDVPEISVNHITCSSFEARAGSIFVCVKGFRSDGHIFAPKAYDNGCRVFITERDIELPPDAVNIKVDNSRRAMALLSCELYSHPSRSLFTIGITGTKGKTTTALMIKQLLDVSGYKTGYIGSNGVLFGDCKLETANTTPDSCKLQEYMKNMLSAGVRAVVMEVSSQALSQGRVLGTDFDITMFSNLSPDHIGPGEHDSFEDYFSAKKKLFDEFGSKTVIANADDAFTEKILADYKGKKIYYSTNAPSDFRAHSCMLKRDGDSLGTSFIVEHGSASVPCSLSIPGQFNIHNALACFALGSEMGLGADFIADTLSKMKIDGRFDTLTAPNGACFVIDYAHNGLSLSSVLKALRAYGPSRLICLFGSVGNRTQVRRVQLGKVASLYADFSILTSDNPDTEQPQKIIDDIATQFESEDKYISIPDRAEAIRYAFRIAEAGDIVLLAGKGHERYQLINGKNEYFCEKEILLDCISESQLLK